LNILIFDLETRPTEAYVWSAWKQNVAPNQVIEHGRVICWCAKWYGEKKTYFGAEWEPTVNGQDFIYRLAAMMDKADAILTYNGDKFDVPVLNTELMKRGLNPPAPSKSIDMYKVVKKNFRLFHGRMDSVAKALGVDGKLDTGGMQLWIDVMQGKKKARKDMEKYNRQDIIVLEDIYVKLRGWIKNHPATDHADGECPNCGGDNLQKRGFHHTKVSKFQRYQCTDCGSWHRGRENLNTKHNRKEIVTL
jgi:hypothetical protein